LDKPFSVSKTNNYEMKLFKKSIAITVAMAALMSHVHAETLPSTASFTKLAEDLRKSKMGEKSEYETEAEYKVRQGKFRFRDGSTLDGEIMFAQAAKNAGCEDKYDAETQKLTLSCTIYRNWGYTNLDIAKKFRTVGSYTGSNAYNHKVQVDKVNSTHQWVNVYYDPNSKITDRNNEFEIKVTVQATPNEAKKIREGWTLGYFVKPLAPFLKQERMHIAPTIDSPTDQWDDTTNLITLFTKLVVYDAKTSSIFGKFSFNGGSLVPIE